MKAFDYYQPTKIQFGPGRLKEVGEAVKQFGTRCLLVTEPVYPALAAIIEKVTSSLKKEGVDIFHFDGVVPNPTTDSIEAGTEMAIEKGADVILGVGGGSSMDTAKAISVGATHEGTAWDYRLFSKNKITDKALPILVVTTTSGTGSQVTAVAVLTKTAENCKYALVDPVLFPKVGIVDPELMVTVPKHITASTGFDVFTHAFESYVHINASVFTDLYAEEALKTIIKYLPVAIEDGTHKIARAQLAWADTLAGCCIANAGTILPHGIGMAIGGHAPHVKHGEALAAMYPEFMRYTYASNPEKFAFIGRLLNPGLQREPDHVAAEESCASMEGFLKGIGMYFTLDELKVPEGELSKIADDSVNLPDYTVNPRVATRDEIFDMLKKRFGR